MRAAARGGLEDFRGAGAEYSELLSAIAATRDLPVADVARAAELSPERIRELRIAGETNGRSPLDRGR